MKTIELTGGHNDLDVEHFGSGEAYVWQGDERIVINKQGAKQLIEVLKELVGDE